jgi:hypothetical protein
VSNAPPNPRLEPRPILLFAGKSLDLEWQPLENHFTLTARQIDNLSSRSEKLAEFAARRRQSVGNSGKQNESITVPVLTKQLSLPEDEAKLPCVILPHIRTSRFFDRADVIERMDNHFNGVDVTKSFRSLALHGLGGVGKSTVALRYTENKLHRGELDALFWVNSEKPVSIRQSFTDIAVRLKLPDARPGDHHENQALVLNWLQHTRKPVSLRQQSLPLTLPRMPLADRVR